MDIKKPRPTLYRYIEVLMQRGVEKERAIQTGMIVWELAEKVLAQRQNGAQNGHPLRP